MQTIKNYLFDINGNSITVFRNENDVMTSNNPFICIQVVNINNEVFIHERENKFIHFNRRYDAEIISLEYKEDNVFSMKILSEEEYESFNSTSINQEIKKILDLSNLEKEVLLELIQYGTYLDDDMIITKEKEKIVFHARKDELNEWQGSFDYKFSDLLMGNYPFTLPVYLPNKIKYFINREILYNFCLKHSCIWVYTLRNNNKKVLYNV